MLQSTSLSTKSDSEHIGIIRKNENIRDTLGNKTHVKHMMKHMLACFPSDVNANEIEYCGNLLQKDRHYRNNCLDRFENDFDLAQLAPREPNQMQEPFGFARTPLLLGQTQMGILTSINIPVARNRLTLRGCTCCTHTTDYRSRETMV